VIVGFKIKKAWIPFIYMDCRPDMFVASLFVGNHYLSPMMYLIVELQLGVHCTVYFIRLNRLLIRIEI
jgi:hypothetical protein